MNERDKTLDRLGALKNIRNNDGCWCVVLDDYHSRDCVTIQDLYAEMLERVCELDAMSGLNDNAAGRTLDVKAARRNGL